MSWKQKETAWKLCTEGGNILFSEGKYKSAIEQYTQAMEIATELLDGHAQAYLDAGIPVVPLYVISCNNLAYTLWELAELDDADNCFLRPLHAVKTITQDPSTRDSIRYKALREVTRIMFTYLDFCSKTGRKGRLDRGMAERLGLSFQQVNSN